MKETFTINDIALMSGLSPRTIRNYLSSGVLSGEKIDGCWAFTSEQIEAFMQNKAVQPSIRAKKNALVYDFMGTKPFAGDKICIVLDLSSKDAAGATSFFCRAISDYSPEGSLHFSSEQFGSGIRLILVGNPRDVMALLNRFYSEN